jgi:hypothetical protein
MFFFLANGSDELFHGIKILFLSGIDHGISKKSFDFSKLSKVVQVNLSQFSSVVHFLVVA